MRIITLPSIRLSLLFVPAIILLLSLGGWQLARSQEKQQILQDYQQMLQSKPVKITSSASIDDYPAFQPVKLEGYFDNKRQVLLDNRAYRGRVGYEVITPLKLADGIVLINRGWIPRMTSRSKLPELQAVEGKLLIEGTIYRPNKLRFQLSDIEENPGQWPLVLQRLDFVKIANALGEPVSSATVRMYPEIANGFIRDWKLVSLPPEKHVAYAMQWFSLALVLVILFFALGRKR